MIRPTLIITACALLLTGCDEDEPPPAQAHWELSATYAANTLQTDDAVVAENLSDSQWALPGADDLPENVFAQYRRMAGKMKLRPLPALYLNATDNQPLPQANAHFTREMHPYILINRAATQAWSARQLNAVLGHELVHLMNHDVTPENLAQAYNHPEISARHEMQADVIGSGPLGSCDPDALISALQIVYASDMQDYLQRNPLKSADDYNDLTGPDHPPLSERRAALEAESLEPAEECRSRMPR